MKGVKGEKATCASCHVPLAFFIMTNDEIQITLPWPPSVNHYYRKVGPRVLISRDGRKYRQVVCSIARQLNVKPFDCELKMEIHAYPPDRRRRDVDNLLKAIFDSLQHGGIYKDDSQIKDFEFYTKELQRPNGKIIVRLSKR